MDARVAEMISMIVILPVTFGLMAWAVKLFFSFLQQRRITKSHFELQGKLRMIARTVRHVRGGLREVFGRCLGQGQQHAA